MGFIRERKVKNGETRYRAEVRLKGHPMETAVFNRRSDAKAWIQKKEADIRCGRQQLYSEDKKHTFKEAAERYVKEQKVTQAKKGHLQWWVEQIGSLYLQDV